MNTTKWRAARAILLGCVVGGLSISQGTLLGRAATTAPSTPRRSLAAEKCSAKGQVGTVDKVVGKAQIKHGHDVLTAKHGTRVYKGDVVLTRGGQKASVTVCGGATVYVNEQSSAMLTSRADLTAKQGEVAEQVSSASKSAHTIHTAEAAARSHGKGGYFDVRAQRGQSEFIVAKGALEVSNKQGKVKVTKDNATTVKPGHAPDPPKAVNTQQLLNWAGALATTASWRILTAPGVLQQPQRLALDTQGNIYVTDPGATDNRVVKLSSSGQVLATWHLQGTSTSPSGVAVDSHNNVYVTDELGATVQKLSPTGQVLAVYPLAPLFPDALVSPSGVAVDAAGNMYVADDYGDRVIKLSPGGQLLATWGSQGSGRGQFDSPEDLAVDAQGNIYVADEFNDRVQKLSSNGQPVAAWSTGQDSSPSAVALTATGNLYVVESNAERIQELSPTGTGIWAWQSEPLGNLQAPGQFDRPYGIAVDSQGTIYVADHYNGRVQTLARS